jgi:hypothetical protein
MAYSPPDTFYSQTKGLENEEDMFKFIGKNGAHFKYLTGMLGIDYIWWQKDTNTIELWGPHRRLPRAKKTMDQKLKKYLKKQSATELESVVVVA